jgi:hypothetical protein
MKTVVLVLTTKFMTLEFFRTIGPNLCHCPQSMKASTPSYGQFPKNASINKLEKNTFYSLEFHHFLKFRSPPFGSLAVVTTLFFFRNLIKVYCQFLNTIGKIEKVVQLQEEMYFSQ